MSSPKKKIGLIATSIRFTNFSIIYDVELKEKIKEVFSIVTCGQDIADKDLLLKPTIIEKSNMSVIFTPSNVTPHFYQSIYDKSIRNYHEYETERGNIYNVGDVVGYITD